MFRAYQYRCPRINPMPAETASMTGLGALRLARPMAAKPAPTTADHRGLSLMMYVQGRPPNLDHSI